MPREIATIDGRRSAFVKAGEGSPVIVFFSGAGMPIDSWFKVYPTAATMSTAIAYDRLGVDRSDRPTVPQTGDIIVATLRTLLQRAGLTPPYLLVGHSLGGLHAELFARGIRPTCGASSSWNRQARRKRLIRLGRGSFLA